MTAVFMERVNISPIKNWVIRVRRTEKTGYAQRGFNDSIPPRINPKGAAMSRAYPRTFEFHTYLKDGGTHCSARENLMAVSNFNNPSQWLFERQRRRAGQIAETGSDKECEDYLDELRVSSEREQNLWRFTQ